MDGVLCALSTYVNVPTAYLIDDPRRTLRLESGFLDRLWFAFIYDISASCSLLTH